MAKKTKNSNNSKTLSNLITYYETCNKCENKSPKTISWYTENLKQLEEYLKSRHLPTSIEALDITVLREYQVYLLNKNKYRKHPSKSTSPDLLSRSTVHGHVRTLRAFFNWLDREDLLRNNISANLKPPKVPSKVIATLSAGEIKTILDALNQHNPTDGRNVAIFMLMIDSGLRIGDVVNLKIQGIHNEEGFLVVRGKGQKERIIPVGNNAWKALQKYLFRYRVQPAHDMIDNVFLSIDGRPLSENSIKLVFRRLAVRSNVSRLHAHLCRHTFATMYLENGGDIFSLQKVLGHSTLEMVRHYANITSIR